MAQQHPAVGHIHLKIADLDRAVRSYREALWLNEMARLDDPAAFLGAGVAPRLA